MGGVMLKIKVQSEAVRSNLELFQDIIRRSRDVEQKIKTYSGFVHRATGAMQFRQEGSLSEKDWKEIDICIDLEHHDISVFEKGKPEQVFQYNDLAPLAYRVMAETLHVLLNLSRTIHDLKEFSYVVLESSAAVSKASRDLIHDAWHQVDREGAEKLLQEKSPGTYLFRKDEYASILENELAAQHQAPIKCVTLSYLDKESVVRDSTLLRFHGHWLIYNDDPKLEGQAYASVEELLKIHDPKLEKPLLHTF